MISSPNCTLHIAIMHVIKVLTVELQVLLAYQNSPETLPFQYFNHVSDCSVQCAIGTRHHEVTVVLSPTI